MGKRFAFITGCSRSGTTALTRLVNRHPRVAIGFERFNRRAGAGELSPELFEAERFRRFDSADSHHTGWKGDEIREPVLEKIATAEVVGDKLPQLIGRMGQLSRFHDPAVIFILREPYAIAKSFDRRARNPKDKWSDGRDFRRAIKEFNAAVQDAEELIRSNTYRHYVIAYETFFLEREGLDDLFAFLGVDPGECAPVDDIYERADELEQDGRASLVAQHVAMNARWGSYRNAMRAGQRQRAQAQV